MAIQNTSISNGTVTTQPTPTRTAFSAANFSPPRGYSTCHFPSFTLAAPIFTCTALISSYHRSPVLSRCRQPSGSNPSRFLPVVVRNRVLPNIGNWGRWPRNDIVPTLPARHAELRPVDGRILRHAVASHSSQHRRSHFLFENSLHNTLHTDGER